MVVITTSKEKLSNNTLCSVFLSFKTLLIFIYGIIYTFIEKLSGINVTLRQTNAENKPENEINEDGNQNIIQQKGLKELRDIPGPKSLPFFGTLLTSSAAQSSDLLNVNLERELKYGPLVKEEHFWNFPLIMVLGTEELKKIVKENFLSRPNMEIQTMYRLLRTDRYNSVGLVNANGSPWKHLHGFFAPTTLNMKFVRSMLTGFNEIASDVTKSLENEQSPTEDGLPRMINKLIAEASFYIAFGQRAGFVGETVKQNEELRILTDCHDIYWNAFHKSMYGFPWWKYFPSKIWDEFTSAEDQMFDIMATVTERLLEDGSAGGILGSIPTEKMEKSDLYAVLLEFILGATEPVFNAVIITLYWIFKHEQVYQRVLAELREQLPTKDSFVDEDVLNNIPYLKACVMETFRICPTTCNVARITEREIQLGEYRLPANTAIIAQTWHACLKDENFYRAKEYLPERWILQDGVPPFKPHERQLLCNFGIGSRSCPGRRIATQLINVFLSKLLRRYKLRFVKDLEIRYEWLLTVQPPMIVEIEENDF